MYIENSRGPRTDPCATSDHLAVYTAELIAIATALHGVEQVKLNKVILCSNSSLALLSLQSFSSQSRQDIISEIYETPFQTS